MSTEESGSAISSLETSQLNGDPPESPGNGDEGILSDAVDNMHERPLSNSGAMAEEEVTCDGLSPDQLNGCQEMVNEKMTISFRPDYFEYGDIYCTDSEVTFSTNCVQVIGSTPYENKGIFRAEFAIEDVIDIQSQWCERFHTAEVKIYVNIRASAQCETINSTSGTEVLKFAVIDSYWREKNEAIVSLNTRFEILWNVLIDTSAEVDKEAMLGHKAFSKRYLPEFDESFEEVIYPQGDIDAVSISMRDVDLLKPDIFINDTIIDFYVKYLKNKIPPEDRHRFHFFNCFFFRKLADMDKDPSSAFQGRAAFLRVRKWTRKVNLFDKDFIFIPVNYNYHWSLIVICHPGEVVNIKDAETSTRVPCILHLDSLRGSHTNLKDLMQSYLGEEWKERQKGTAEDVSSKFLNMRFVSLELPQQQNFYDCGLFLLHYIELFLEDAPANFSPFMITTVSTFLNVNWFPPAEPSIKRSVIQRLIYNLLEKRSQSPYGSSEKCGPSNNLQTDHDNHNSFELIMERSSPSKDGHGHLLKSDNGQGTEADLLQASSFRSSQCVSDSGLALRDIFEPTSSEALSLDSQYQAFARTTSFDEFGSGMPRMPPIEEEMEAELYFTNSTLAETHLQHLDATPPEPRAPQFTLEDYESEAVCDRKTSLEEKPNDIDSLKEKSTSDSYPTSEVEIADNLPTADGSLDDKIDHPLPVVPSENIEYLETCDHTHKETMDVSLTQSPVQTLDHSSFPTADVSSEDKIDHPVPESAENIVSSKTCDLTPNGTMEVSATQSPGQIMLDHSNFPAASDDPLPVSAESIEYLETCDYTPKETMEDSATQSSLQMLDHSNNGGAPSTCLPEISHQTDGKNLQENDGTPCDDMQIVASDLGSELDVNPPAKKIRLTCPSEEGKEFTITLSKDLNL